MKISEFEDTFRDMWKVAGAREITREDVEEEIEAVRKP